MTIRSRRAPVAMNVPAGQSVRREVASAYLASAARVAAWAGVSAILFRTNEIYFAAFALVRATIGLLNYAFLGLAPAMIHQLARAGSAREQPPSVTHPTGPRILNYEAPSRDPLVATYSHGLLVAYLVGTFGVVLVGAYTAVAEDLHNFWLRDEMFAMLVSTVGMGTVFRLVSDAPGALLQSTGRILADNVLIAVAEISWLLLTLAQARLRPALDAACLSYALSGALLLLLRLLLAWHRTGLLTPRWRLIRRNALLSLLATGAVIAVSQVADFLYAPTNFILIEQFLSTYDLAAYAPVLQIDAALLLLAGGVASVLLPRTAIAYAAGDLPKVRRYYIRGSIVASGALLLGAVAVWLAAPHLIRRWLGASGVVDSSISILPLVLIHTVLGGSSAVGRSVLLGIGRARAFTIAALSAGVANVILAYVLVRYTNLGLKGIIYATILVVFVRAIVWMPAYVLWSLRHPAPPAPVAQVPPAPIA